MINRAQKRQLNRQIAVSKTTIKRHLDFLNQVGSPKYQLVKIKSQADRFLINPLINLAVGLILGAVFVHLF